MSLRNIIIQKHLDEQILEVIWHDFSAHIPQIFKVFLRLFVLYVIYRALMSLWFWQEYFRWWVAIVALVLLWKFMVDFFNIYLDALVLTRRGIKVFTWESLLEHKIDEFEREHLQVISFEWNTIWDKLFDKWDINVALTNNFEFSFDEVRRPNDVVKKLYYYKDKFLSNQTEPEDSYSKEKFDALVETLGEVILEYMNRNKKINNLSD